MSPAGKGPPSTPTGNPRPHTPEYHSLKVLVLVWLEDPEEGMNLLKITRPQPEERAALDLSGGLFSIRSILWGKLYHTILSPTRFHQCRFISASTPTYTAPVASPDCLV